VALPVSGEAMGVARPESIFDPGNKIQRTKSKKGAVMETDTMVQYMVEIMNDAMPSTYVNYQPLILSTASNVAHEFDSPKMFPSSEAKFDRFGHIA
jgi:hypothetical protein